MFEVSDADRTLNYAKFQLSLVMERLNYHYKRGSSRMCFVHLVSEKERLIAEIDELYKQRRRRSK